MSTGIFKTNGREIYKVVKPGTSGLNENSFLNSTGSTVNLPFTGLLAERQEDLIPVSLSVSGDWTNTQYVSTAVDTTGLTFTATMNDETTKTVSVSLNPSTWSSTTGTQTCTFSYTEYGTTVSCSKSAEVEEPAASYMDFGMNISVALDSSEGRAWHLVINFTDGSNNIVVPLTGEYYKSLSDDPIPDIYSLIQSNYSSLVQGFNKSTADIIKGWADVLEQAYVSGEWEYVENIYNYLYDLIVEREDRTLNPDIISGGIYTAVGGSGSSTSETGEDAIDSFIYPFGDINATTYNDVRLNGPCVLTFTWNPENN